MHFRVFCVLFLKVGKPRDSCLGLMGCMQLGGNRDLTVMPCIIVTAARNVLKASFSSFLCRYQPICSPYCYQGNWRICSLQAAPWDAVFVCTAPFCTFVRTVTKQSEVSSLALKMEAAAGLGLVRTCLP